MPHEAILNGMRFSLPEDDAGRPVEGFGTRSSGDIPPGLEGEVGVIQAFASGTEETTPWFNVAAKLLTGELGAKVLGPDGYSYRRLEGMLHGVVDEKDPDSRRTYMFVVRE
jgi:hypothetical protein